MSTKRNYKGPDIDMLSSMRDMCTHFEANLAAFSAFDPSLDATFLANWKTVQDNAWRDVGDEREVIEGEILLEKAVTALEKCQLKYIDVKYYAGKAFPNNKEALKEFGQGVYSKVRKSPLKMVQFMETLHGVATKYKTQLIAQHYTQAAIDEIETLTNHLRTDNQAQQLKKKERPTETRNRVELLNTYYGFGQQVAAVAPIVFRQSEAKRKLFRLAERKPAPVTKTWVTLAANSTRKTAIAKLLKKNKLTLTNQSKETIPYWQANNINDTPAEKYFLTAGEVVEITAEEPVRKFLVVQNTSAKAVRVVVTKEKKG